MIKREILDLIRWDEKTKTIHIGSGLDILVPLDISIKVNQDITGNMETRDIGGFNCQTNIKGANSQGDIGGNNRQFNINGNNNQWNIGGNNRQLNVKGNSYNSKHYVVDGISTSKVNCVEGFIMHSIKERNLRNGTIITEGFDVDGYQVWLVRNNLIGCHSHVSLEDAKQKFKYKTKK